MKLLRGLLAVAPLAFLAVGHPSPTTIPLQSRLVHQFAEGTWVENIAVRSNGNLLVTILDPAAALWHVAKPASASPRAELIYTFPSVTGLLGITEFAADKFVIVGGNFTAPGISVAGSFAAWTVDVSGSVRGAKVKLLTAIPEAVFLNGLTTIHGCSDEVLISDSSAGLVFKLNIRTGKYSVAIKVPEMAVKPGSPIAIGINGIKSFDGFLYWSNSFYATIYRAKLDRDGSLVRNAKIETVATEPAIFIDDITIDDDGIVWANSNLDNQLFAISPRGRGSVLAVGATTELTVAGNTAAAFGRTRRDAEILYVVTSGAAASPVNGTFTEGGKIVAVDTTGFHF